MIKLIKFSPLRGLNSLDQGPDAFTKSKNYTTIIVRTVLNIMSDIVNRIAEINLTMMNRVIDGWRYRMTIYIAANNNEYHQMVLYINDDEQVIAADASFQHDLGREECQDIADQVIEICMPYKGCIHPDNNADGVGYVINLERHELCYFMESLAIN